MSVVYVRLTGDDGLGDGSFTNPFRTIEVGVLAALPGDTVDVGPGDFLEPNKVVVDKHLVIRGKNGLTRWQGATPSPSNYTMLEVTPTVTQDGKFLLTGFFMEPLVSGYDAIITTAPGSGVFYKEGAFVSRCVFRFVGNEIGFQRWDSEKTIWMLVNNTLVSRVPGTYAGRVVHYGGFGPDLSPIAFVNNIVKGVKRFVETKLDFSNPVFSTHNMFFDNEREFMIGEVADTDLHADPRFKDELNGDYSLLPGSPALDVGVDVTKVGIPTRHPLVLTPSSPLGNGTYMDSILPPPEINWGGSGKGVDIGAFEVPVTSGKKNVNNFNTHTILSAFADEYAKLDAVAEKVKAGRSVVTADATQLQERWGRLLNMFKPDGFSRNDYEELLVAAVKAGREAPAWRAVIRIIGEILRCDVIRHDYHRIARFRLGDDLKLFLPNPGGDPFRVRVSAGRFQLLRQWWDFIEQDYVAGSNDLAYLFASPISGALVSPGRPMIVNLTITNDEALQQDTLILNGYAVRARKGSTKIERIPSGSYPTDFLTVPLQPMIKVYLHIDNPGNIWFPYRIESVEDKDHLTLTAPYEGEDFDGTMYDGIPIFPLGTVATDDFGVIRLVTHSRLGSTSFADSLAARMNGYEFQPTKADTYATVFK